VLLTGHYTQTLNGRYWLYGSCARGGTLALFRPHAKRIPGLRICRERRWGASLRRWRGCRVPLGGRLFVGNPWLLPRIPLPQDDIEVCFGMTWNLSSWAAWRPTLRRERGRVGHPLYLCDIYAIRSGGWKGWATRNGDGPPQKRLIISNSPGRQATDQRWRLRARQRFRSCR